MNSEDDTVILYTQLTAGQIVNYVLPSGHQPGTVRPAIITRVWSNDCCNLRVFLDGENDYPAESGLMWVGSAFYSESRAPGTWHYWAPDILEVPG